MAMHNPPRPGEFIQSTYMEPFGVRCRSLAEHLNVAASTLNRILKLQSGVSPEMALRLSKVLGRSPESWLAMQTFMRQILLILLCLVLGACGFLNTVRYYAPSLEAGGTTAPSQDGIAFLVGSTCVHVVDTSKFVQPHALTLFGVPLLPLSLGVNEKPISHFDLSIWLIPERGDMTSLFEVPRIELEFDDGSRVRPRTVQVSRFRTQLQKEQVYLVKPGIEETIYYPEHWHPKPPGNFSEPLELWDWTRLNVRFEKASASLQPTRLIVDGLLHKQSPEAIPTITFSRASEIRQAFPGRFADGVWVGDYPDKACRKLQKLETR